MGEWHILLIDSGKYHNQQKTIHHDQVYLEGFFHNQRKESPFLCQDSCRLDEGIIVEAGSTVLHDMPTYAKLLAAKPQALNITI